MPIKCRNHGLSRAYTSCNIYFPPATLEHWPFFVNLLFKRSSNMPWLELIWKSMFAEIPIFASLYFPATQRIRRWRAKGQRNLLSVLTLEQLNLGEPLITSDRKRSKSGRPREVDMREIAKRKDTSIASMPRSQGAINYRQERYIAADAMRRLMVVAVTAAVADNAEAARSVMKQLRKANHPSANG
jgi:hypothetical protein